MRGSRHGGGFARYQRTPRKRTCGAVYGRLVGLFTGGCLRQVQLDKEDEALSRARLGLADARVHAEAASGGGGAASAIDGGEDSEERQGRGAAEGGSTATAGGSDEARERELRRQQAAAEAAARAEEAKLRRAQSEVRAQMAKVAALEKSIR